MSVKMSVQDGERALETPSGATEGSDYPAPDSATGILNKVAFCIDVAAFPVGILVICVIISSR